MDCCNFIPPNYGKECVELPQWISSIEIRPKQEDVEPYGESRPSRIYKPPQYEIRAVYKNGFKTEWEDYDGPFPPQ